jgi:flagellar biosynthesis GTPase FlhF
MIHAEPGFPRQLLGQPSAAKLKYFQDFTIAHPRLVEANDRLTGAIRDSAPNSIIFVLGPTGVGKTTLRRRIE